MAKEAPTLTVTVDDSGGNGQDISTDVTNCDWATPRNTQEVTGVDSSAVERLLLLADYSATLNGVFDDAASMAHDVFKDVSSTSVTRTVSIVASGQTLDVEALLTDYQLTRAQSGELTWSVPASLQDGSAPTWA